MKHALTLLIGFLFLTSGFSQETKVIIKGAKGMGKFYLYVDSNLINRAPQLQVGVLDLLEKASYNFRVVFQDSARMPLTGTFTTKFEHTKVYVLYGGSVEEVAAQKADETNQDVIPGNTAPSHPSMPKYTGRLGCDYPIGSEVIEQIVSQMTSNLPKTPIEIAMDAITVECFTVDQFSKILHALPENKDKISLSKAAWYYLYDQENFKNLAHLFENPSDMDEILQFVQRNQ